MKTWVTFAAIFTATVLSFTTASAGSFHFGYSMIDLGTLGGDSSVAVRINTRGQVIGSSTTAAGETHAFLWQRGVMRDLGTMGHVNSRAVDINERGQIIGFAFGEDFPDTTSRGFIRQHGVLTDLGTPAGGHTLPFDINELGQVVGWWSEDELGDPTNAFLWFRGRRIDLGTLGGFSAVPMAINNRGQIVGESELANGIRHAFLWERGEMMDLDPLNEGNSVAVGINDGGQIIGTRGINTPTCPFCSRAFFLDDGVKTDITLGGESSSAASINHRGQVVGSSQTPSGDTHAFLWHKGDIIDLGTLGGDLSFATAINEFGQVVGVSTTVTGDRHGFVWERGVMTDLGPVTRDVADINNLGVIVGTADERATLWERRLNLVPFKLDRHEDFLRDLLHDVLLMIR